MATPQNIALIGYMGVGKSTVGRALSHKLHCGFYDTDDMIVQDTGKSIEKIFAEDGEAAFRKKETEILKKILETSSENGRVIACGGGLPLSKENQELLKAHCFTVELICSDDVLAERIEADGTVRPLLAKAANHEALLKEISKMKMTRRFYYESAADIKVETDILDMDDVLDSIMLFGEMWQNRRDRM
ncbi:MAG: shikimate kinase [Pseudoramibacter sp.]